MNRPHMGTQSGFHRSRNAERLMHAHEVVVHVEQRNRVNMILKLLAERVGQASEAPHIHPHVEILPFNKRSRNMLGIGIAGNGLRDCAKTLRGAVPSVSFKVTSIDLDEHRVVYAALKRVGHGIQVHLMAVRRQLDAIRQTRFNITKELSSKPRVSPSNHVADDQLRFGINRGERPNVATNAVPLNFFNGHMLLLAANERPDFIGLNAWR